MKKQQGEKEEREGVRGVLLVYFHRRKKKRAKVRERTSEAEGARQKERDRERLFRLWGRDFIAAIILRRQQ